MGKRAERLCWSRNALNRQFDQKWVLIRNPVYDEDKILVVAEVIAYSKDKNRVCKKMPKKKSSVEYRVLFAEKPVRDPNVFILPSVWAAPDPEFPVSKKEDRALSGKSAGKKGKSTWAKS